jgi:PIN domain nuclease of toxin-antitoxin system
MSQISHPKQLEPLAQGAYISIVNWAEVLSKVADIGENPQALAQRLKDEGLLGNSREILNNVIVETIFSGNR